MGLEFRDFVILDVGFELEFRVHGFMAQPYYEQLWV